MGKDLKGNELGAGLYQRKDGRYEGRYKDRYGKTKSVYGFKLREVKAERKRLEREEMLAQPSEECLDDITLDDWVKRWLPVYKASTTESTRMQYKNTYERYISPIIGSKKVNEIRNIDLVELFNILGQKYYKNTMILARTMTHNIFEKAVANNIISKNPMNGVKAFGFEAEDRVALTNEQQKKFLNAVKGSMYEDLFIVALNTGLRSGELCALRWCDIDIKKKRLSITRTLNVRPHEDESQRYYVNSPKTKGSIRTVYFNDECAAALIRQFSRKSDVAVSCRYDPIVGFEDLLFTTKYGMPFRCANLNLAISRVVKRVNKNATDDDEKLPEFSMHCLRHTYATRCLEAGVSPKVVQQQLGHKTLKMTMDLYTHALDDFCADEIGKLESISANSTIAM